MKKIPADSRAISGIRVFLIATLVIALTPHLFADITFVSRLSDARASAGNYSQQGNPPPQTQTDLSPANLSNSATVGAESGFGSGHSTSVSSIAIDNSTGTVRVTGNGTANTSAIIWANAHASAKLIVLTFTLTDFSYLYSLSGQLSGSIGYCPDNCANAKLLRGGSPIFELSTGGSSQPVTLSESGTLPPGDYTLSIDLNAVSDCGQFGCGGSPSSAQRSADFSFQLDPTVTPTPPSVVNISGNVSYCSNPTSGPVPNVMLSLSGSASGSTPSDGSGNYSVSSLATGGSYTVTPAKTGLAPAAAGINTTDVIAIQRHFLSVLILTGCRLNAADANGDSSVNTIDVLAVQRFFLGIGSGIANVGKYQFSPVTRNYPNLGGNQSNQNYDTLIFGDVAAPFVAP